MEREEDLRYRCLSPPQIKLQGHLCRQPMVPRDTTSSLEELDLCIESGGPRLYVRSTTEPNSGAIESLSYGPPWAHYLGGYQDRLLGGPLGLPGLRYTAPDGVEHKDYGGEVLG
jgi:hypothetical protein